MKTFIYAIVILLTLHLCFATEDKLCPQRLLAVGTYDTFGDDTGGSLPTRMQSLGAGSLLRAFEKQKLDVMCLPNTFSNTYRQQLFANFGNYTVYAPGSDNIQPGCQNACYTNVSFTASGFTFPINKWVEYCTLTPLPGTTTNCGAATSDAAYEQCLINLCPFLFPLINDAQNSQCLNCLTSTQPGEDRVNRMVRCTGTYIDEEAANCKQSFGGTFTAPVVFRRPPVERDVAFFPAAINPATNKGVVYAKINTAFGNVNVFCAHLLQGAQRIPSNTDPNLVTAQAQAKFVINYITSKTVAGEPNILIGDFNAGLPNKLLNITGIWKAEIYDQFNKLANPKFADAFFLPVCTKGCNGVFPQSPVRESVDHIFYQGKLNKTIIYPFNSARFLKAKNVPFNGRNISASDHYGIRTTFCRNPLGGVLDKILGDKPVHFFARPMADFNKPIERQEDSDLPDNDKKPKPPKPLPVPIPIPVPPLIGRNR